MGKQRWEMKQKKKRTRAQLRKRANEVKCARLRAQVTSLARLACGDSRIGRCISRYTQFALEPDGSISCGFKPITDINRNECQHYLDAGFVPEDPKGLLEKFVERIDWSHEPATVADQP